MRWLCFSWFAQIKGRLFPVSKASILFEINLPSTHKSPLQIREAHHLLVFCLQRTEAFTGGWTHRKCFKCEKLFFVEEFIKPTIDLVLFLFFEFYNWCMRNVVVIWTWHAYSAGARHLRDASLFIGCFPDLSTQIQLFDGLKYWYCWAFCDSLVELIFEKNRNVLHKIIQHPSDLPGEPTGHPHLCGVASGFKQWQAQIFVLFESLCQRIHSLLCCVLWHVCPECMLHHLLAVLLLWLGVFHIFFSNCSCLMASGTQPYFRKNKNVSDKSIPWCHTDHCAHTQRIHTFGMASAVVFLLRCSLVLSISEGLLELAVCWASFLAVCLENNALIVHLIVHFRGPVGVYVGEPAVYRGTRGNRVLQWRVNILSGYSVVRCPLILEVFGESGLVASTRPLATKNWNSCLIRKESIWRLSAWTVTFQNPHPSTSDHTIKNY